MNLKLYYLGFLIYLLHQLKKCKSEMERITYISTEHPNISFYDTKYYKKVTLTSHRFSREDPRYYVDLHIISLYTVNNNVNIDFYFYQFLTNRYRPSFVEVHTTFCGLLNSDPIFGLPIRMAIQNRTCPFPPGDYDLRNLTIPAVPKNFPFSKGRIYCNVSIVDGGVVKLIGSGSIDMEVKVARIRRKEKNV